ncbi:4-(cytidine 5'-diphospho)-2-C-methyl-D-erythritol kinase [Campylobacter sp. 10_1_50]|uniref:4-(cytidine 5'-diphospho)-2-C-methyl-D-erythritol kinase n=1 Tax=Campylobacter TaxID=194 RepID=UPI0002410A37|nr:MULTISPECIES: 4-(cytidine 5'-diphospho)-2-C-methyl-D-erythritol kinase [Campylobacter]EHL90915.1 4-(cytidine 5'-diphospho)-2-C-methyl-D-erythritol kinase [Campylobacter sp. 10_1_50]
MKSFAKINVFLKVVGTRGNYHEILSRFVLCEQLFDEIYFERSNSFTIECDNKEIKENIIQKAIDELKKAGFSNELDEFFSSHKIIISKQIPIGAGLGGGSSNAATFLLMVNDELNLNIKRENLIQIASKIGADVAFFVSGYRAANVSGIGEIIEEFDDEVPNLNIFTPNVFCSTPMVYQEFRSNFLQYIDVNAAKKMQNLKSKELLEIYKNEELNDLFAPCFKLYPQMNEFKDKFLSGSGSSVFSVK